jgi:hypothetical protein
VTDFVAPPPPPPSMSGAVSARPGPIGWAAVPAGVLGLLALFLPWFSPKLSKPVNGLTNIGDYHAWSGFLLVLGVAGPILLMLFGALWLQALRGRPNSRFAGSTNPTRSLSLQSVVAGVIALVLGLLAFPLMTHHYKNWDEAAKELKSLGATLEKNPQPGIYLLLIGAVVLIAVGVAGLLTSGSSAAQAAPAPGAAPADSNYGNAPGSFPPAGPPQS